MNRLLILLAILSGWGAGLSARPNILPETIHTTTSPDGRYELCVYQREASNGGRQLYYTLSYGGKGVVEESELGVVIDNRLFESALGIPNDTLTLWGANLELTGVERSSVARRWSPVYGERSSIKDNHNQTTFHLRKGTGEDGSLDEGYDKRSYYVMEVVVRAYDEGVAFRYSFPEATNGLFLHIVGEQTQFTMPIGTVAYYERWAQGGYSLLPLEGWTDECERPLTMKLPNGLTVTLAEAELTDYARMKLRLSDKPNTLEASLYGSVDVITPYNTPWRVIMAAEKATELIANNDIILNLNPPCKVEDTSWIQPGKAMRVMDLRQTSAIECIDFAAQRGLQYVHLDARWYGPEMEVASDATSVAEEKDLDIPALVTYGADRGVGVWLYVNQRALAGQLNKILPLYRKWGVKGVKFGFVQVGSQMWNTWLHDAIRKCAEYGLMVDIHDEYRPTGFSRTYPNLMTQEGLRGNEEMPDATHNTTLPFTRFLAGAGDYTICYYNDRIKTTHAHQLALAAIYYSPLQFLYWYDQPSAYEGEAEIEFFDKVKTVWDDTRVLDGEIGEHISIARRSAEEWFVGAITNNDPRKVSLAFDFLDPDVTYLATIYYDDDRATSRTKVGITRRLVGGATVMNFDLKASGGCAINLTPASGDDIKRNKRAKSSALR